MVPALVALILVLAPPSKPRPTPEKVATTGPSVLLFVPATASKGGPGVDAWAPLLEAAEAGGVEVAKPRKPDPAAASGAWTVPVLEAALSALEAKGTTRDRVVVVAAEGAGAVVFQHAHRHPSRSVRGAILLTAPVEPGRRDPSELVGWGNRPLLMITARAQAGDAKALFSRLAVKDRAVVLQVKSDEARGTALLSEVSSLPKRLAQWAKRL